MWCGLCDWSRIDIAVFPILSSRVTLCHPSLWHPLPVGCNFSLPSNACRPEPWQHIFLSSFDFIHSGWGISISCGSSFTWPQKRQEMAFLQLTNVLLSLKGNVQGTSLQYAYILFLFLKLKASCLFNLFWKWSKIKTAFWLVVDF